MFERDKSIILIEASQDCQISPLSEVKMLYDKSIDCCDQNLKSFDQSVFSSGLFPRKSNNIC